MKSSKFVLVFLGLFLTIYAIGIKFDYITKYVPIMKKNINKDIKSLERFYEAFDLYEFSGVNEFESKPNNYPFVGITEYTDSITMNIYLNKTKIIHKVFRRKDNTITCLEETYACPHNIIKETQLCLFPQTGLIIAYGFIIKQNESTLLNITFKHPTYEKEYNLVENLSIKAEDIPYVFSEGDLNRFELFRTCYEINNYRIQTARGKYIKTWLRDEEEIIIDSIPLEKLHPFYVDYVQFIK